MATMQRVGTTATSVFKDSDGYMKCVYHQTCVVAWNDKEIILRTGGWYTNTTKARMNQCANQFKLPFQVFQKAHKWFVCHGESVIEFNNTGEHTILL